MKTHKNKSLDPGDQNEHLESNLACYDTARVFKFAVSGSTCWPNDCVRVLLSSYQILFHEKNKILLWREIVVQYSYEIEFKCSRVSPPVNPCGK